MLATVEDVKALLRRVSYENPWAEGVQFTAEERPDRRVHVMAVFFGWPHNDAGGEKLPQFAVRSDIIAEDKGLLVLPCTDEQVIDATMLLLMAVEDHERCERFKVDGAAIFHPHFDGREKTQVMAGEFWVHQSHRLERRIPMPFNLAERIAVWQKKG